MHFLFVLSVLYPLTKWDVHWGNLGFLSPDKDSCDGHITNWSTIIPDVGGMSSDFCQSNRFCCCFALLFVCLWTPVTHRTTVFIVFERLDIESTILRLRSGRRPAQTRI